MSAGSVRLHGMASYSVDPAAPDEPYLAFWRERHLCTLTTLRPDGSPHVVPVGVTYDPDARLARVITNKSSTKVSHVLAAGSEGGAGGGVPGGRPALGHAGGPGRTSAPSGNGSRRRSGATRNGTSGRRRRTRPG